MLKVVSVALVFLLSWFFPITGALWDQLDASLFCFLQEMLQTYPSSHFFWAFMNSRYADWVVEGLFLSLFSVAVWQKELTMKDVFLMIGIVVGVQVLINKFLFVKLLRPIRYSPASTLGALVNLEELFPLPNNHIFSRKSFPADHATTLFLLAGLSAAYLPLRKSAFAALLAAVFTLPRLVAGGHWLSDVVIGAGGITLATLCFFCAWRQGRSAKYRPQNVSATD